MRLSRFVLIASVFGLCSLANANSIPVFSTGNGSTVDGTVDTHWTFTDSGNSTSGNAKVGANPGVDFFNGAPPWVANTSSSAWIVDNTSNSQSGGGSLIFTQTFSMAGLDPTTAAMSLSWAIDDTGTLVLNGHTIGTLSTQGFSWDILNSVTVPAADFIAGTNTLVATVTNNDNTFEGTNVSITSATANALVGTPEPATWALFGLGVASLRVIRRRKS
jgi:hypothetical protein